MKMIINKLKKTFIGFGEVRGFYFEQVNETEYAYMYKVIVDNKVHYEVFKKNISAVCIDFKNRIYSDVKFNEVYPKSNRFGVSAWCLNSINDANKKLQSITK